MSLNQVIDSDPLTGFERSADSRAGGSKLSHRRQFADVTAFSTAFLILGVFPGFCQIAIKKSQTVPRGPAGPVQIHQLFFERLANSTPRNPFTFQNDLTYAERAILNNVADDCNSKLQRLNDRPVVLEARVRFVESGEGQEDWMDKRLAELKTRRELMVLEHVQALRTSLGEQRFQALETFIQDWYKSLSVVSATGNPASPAPVKMQPR
ncbi:MAG TPA: hypothetical protein VIY49_01795 [Bryobacteraceae bacterium]